ncbi:hypothetical protein LS68_002935 [Helicobacter sp. MIT 05-5293]|uniref:HP0729 family protein n=1 Tax=Helicobacter sp. MIT 05-5293 TaxID=1548149 RepID=UPI0010FD1541|nr:HP0729 family protein [Helicobacter sp. MIT 05-5293]TLD81984.1 hypothetical protein LS68_002935 [Helicobacter sp. MIT 05-5293]
MPKENLHLLILYNPYYQSDVIESHLEILKREGKVAFGKVKSKLRQNVQSPHIEMKSLEVRTSDSINAQSTESASLDSQYMEISRESKLVDSQSLSLESLEKSISPINPLQLFLSDYANLFVCKITHISPTPSATAPMYYAQKGLDVEWWFCIEDIRELVRNDFVRLRDYFLPNFTTPHNGNRTYALYGNDYTYPLFVRMKDEKDYFETCEIAHYHHIFKSQEQINMRHTLTNYVFAERLTHSMHPDTMDNLISAELEYQANKDNPLYDSTGIILWYAKSMEQEIEAFVRILLGGLTHQNPEILDINLKETTLSQWLKKECDYHLNIGSLGFLLRHILVRKTLESWRNDMPHKRDENPHKATKTRHEIYQFVCFTLPSFIERMQSIRNPAAHLSKPKIAEANVLRKMILGIEGSNILVDMLIAKEVLQQKDFSFFLPCDKSCRKGRVEYK